MANGGFQEGPAVRITTGPQSAFPFQAQGNEDRRTLMLDLRGDLEPVRKIRKAVEAKFHQIAGKRGGIRAPGAKIVSGDDRADDTRNTAQLQCPNQFHDMHADTSCGNFMSDRFNGGFRRLDQLPKLRILLENFVLTDGEVRPVKKILERV